jgi:hypothetical protein
MVEDTIVFIGLINMYKQKKYNSTWREKMKPGQWIYTDEYIYELNIHTFIPA